MNITYEQLFVCVMMTILASIAPIYFKKYATDKKRQNLIIGIVLFALLIYFIYYSLMIKVSLLLTVISYKVFALIFLSLASFFIFKESKLTTKKIIALLAIVIGIYYLEN